MSALAAFLRRRPAAPPSLSRLRESGGPYPVLGVEALVDLLDLTNRLRSIRRLLGIDQVQYDALYRPAITRFVESAQLLPASANHHHRDLGGLSVHTLEVVELALRGRKNRLLPVHSDPGVQMAEEHWWTMGVFVAALLHDGGKLLTLCRFRLDNHARWSPLGVPLAETGAASYRLDYLPPDYALQKRLSGTLLSFVPALSRDMMTANVDVLAQVSACLADDAHEWGEVGEIVHTADRTSVARDLQHGASGAALADAPAALPRRMMAALRAEIADGLLALNRDGGGGWYDGTHVWLVCRVATARIERRLRAEGARDLPEEATTLFDLLQEQHYLIPTPTGRAVWNVHVRGDDYAHAFTMLKFAAPRILPRGRTVRPFDGTIEVIDRAALRDLQAREQAGSAASDARSGTEPDDAGGADEAREADDGTLDASSDERTLDSPGDESPPRPAPPGTAPDPEPQPPSAPAPSAGERPAKRRTPAGGGRPEPPARPTAQGEATPDARETAVREVARRLEAMAVVRWSDIECEPVPLEHDDIARYFLTWVRRNLEDGRFIMNEKTAFVHVLPEGIFLVSPRVFLIFMRECSLLAPSGSAADQREAELTARNRLQNRLLVSGLAVPNHRKALVHGATVAARPGLRGNPLAGALIPPWVLFEEDRVPPVNTAVTLNAVPPPAPIRARGRRRPAG